MVYSMNAPIIGNYEPATYRQTHTHNENVTWKKTRFADGLCTGHSLFYFNTAGISQICMCFFFLSLSLLPDMHLPTHTVYVASVLFYFYNCVTLWLRNKLTTTIINSSEFCCCSISEVIDLSISARLAQILIWSAFLDVT